MTKLLAALFIVLVSIFVWPKLALAKASSFVTVVNPIRGSDFWNDGEELSGQTVSSAVDGQVQILKLVGIPATWLLRFDAMSDGGVLKALQGRPFSHELGIFLEVTPTWAIASEVKYNQSVVWHSAKSVFLAGYSLDDRKKLIDSAFERFKETFGFYPVSVGAWWVDAYSIGYMKEKYGVISVLIVSDQYSTDNYQIWGQYFGYPYIPSKVNALYPAQSVEESSNVVVLQWAARDPVGGYGKGVEESTLSVQPNDYIDYHELSLDYFEKLLGVYLGQSQNQVNQVVVGLENSYPWIKYQQEYKAQMQLLSRLRREGKLQIVTMGGFGQYYLNRFPGVSPDQTIVADEVAGGDRKAVWFMNPFYRAGWIYDGRGSVLRDLRQYVGGIKEICYEVECESLNFATSSPSRVLDEVTYGQYWLLDVGKISSFAFRGDGDNLRLSYIATSGNERVVKFMERDIALDERVFSVDGAILYAIANFEKSVASSNEFLFAGSFKVDVAGLLVSFIKFFAAVIFLVFLPGKLISNFVTKDGGVDSLFLSVAVGISVLTIVGGLSAVLNVWWFVYIYGIASLVLFVVTGAFRDMFAVRLNLSKWQIVALIIILLGTLVQVVPVVKSGMLFDFGLGFWGPNGRDGVWHVALVKQIMQGFPLENPILGGSELFNYHYFYDLLVATVAYAAKVEVMDLVFRFFPILFSLLLGLASICFLGLLVDRKSKIYPLSVLFSLMFVYFAGSFGWVVDYMRNGAFWGESVFWASQSVSYNLNPPFFVSLLVVVAIFYFVRELLSVKAGYVKFILLVAIGAGLLVGFKSYGAILLVAALGLAGLVSLIVYKKVWPIITFLLSGATVFLTGLGLSGGLGGVGSLRSVFEYSPLWLVHSMVDSPDRVGWVKLSGARSAYYFRGEWLKFLSAEALGVVLFIVGNLGTKVIALLALVKYKEILGSQFRLFVLVFALLGAFIPLIFVQSGTAWNSVQFFYYSMYVAAVVAGVVVAWVVVNLRVFGWILAILVLLTAPVNTFVGVLSYAPALPQAYVGESELEALEHLAKEEDGVVLTYPFNPRSKNLVVSPFPVYIYDSTAYVSALSGKSVYITDEVQNEILSTDYKERVAKSVDFFSGRERGSRKFLDQENIKYIYILKSQKSGLDDVKLGLEKIFGNRQVLVYKVI